MLEINRCHDGVVVATVPLIACIIGAVPFP